MTPMWYALVSAPFQVYEQTDVLNENGRVT